MINLSEFYGPNAGYIWDLWERYRRDPQSVDASTRAYFDQHASEFEGAQAAPAISQTGSQNGARMAPTTDLQVGAGTAALPLDEIIHIVNLASAIREYGHLAAHLDPLGSPPPDDPTLHLDHYGLSEEELRQAPSEPVRGPLVQESQSAWEAIQKLREVYSSTTGYDYDHLRNPEERDWLRHVAESKQFRPPNDPINPTALLKRLTEVEGFEQFLQRTFPGKTRFSIEGLDMMVPLLDEIVGEAADSGIYTILLGMAHRGRLNVMAHLLCKSYETMLFEFKDPLSSDIESASNELGWTGDVKYHAGARRDLYEGDTLDLVISIAPNPSHLEHVNPVVEGMARAAGTFTDEAGAPRFDHHISLPILIHGDAAFSAQGIVAETLNMSRIPGYLTGGTIHIIANNQLGFTTDPVDGRSTLYASDLAKGFKIPIIHVNADDPIACIEAGRIAMAYRDKFKKDFLIDLIGYRRYGHNEGDEPRFTQPLMYKEIDAHATVRQQWADKLVQEKMVDESQPQELLQQQLATLQEIFDKLKVEDADLGPELEPPPPGAAGRVRTAVEMQALQELLEALLTFPQDFALNSRLQRVFSRRRQSLEAPNERNVDWGTAEQLAFASILADGTSIRMTGQDVERGTFSHRHAVLFDAEDGEPYTPLHNLPQATAAFEIHNSPLSENAAIGYEYGYNIQKPERLVIWEAQYGDFINGAQPVIDEFLVSGRAKWEQTPSLVLLLPHGYEGQGPDHSTGRLERFLQMAAETNMRVANCTTAAQYFHLLRRQAALLKTDPLPLIVMTPKSLLRNPQAMSSLQELAEGHWQPVIDDPDISTEKAKSDKVKRLILCSGKIYTDLISNEKRKENNSLAIARVEQLYPFPLKEVQGILDRYPNLSEVVWVQEEAQNMGAWEFVRPLLEELLDGKYPLRYIGRPRRASPAEGSSAWHQSNQAAIIEQALAMAKEAVVTTAARSRVD
ncbi:MAG: 2-oxoglutarate dehydrogenase E1 component [Caldilineaceae bacterium]|nr:2-oxoglutarate dehydrogenase E1 component [Caldilineaceae bacterium]